MTRDEELARDYTQDIFLRLLTRTNQYEGRSRFSTWLFTLTRNYCITQLRSKRSLVSPISDENEWFYDSDDEQEAKEHRLKSLRSALSSLNRHEMELLQMKYFDELEMTQISKELSLNVSAIKMRLKRSRDKLRTRIELLDII
jgi:RNA polymerase sigma-70 factor (ECF subfamily)